MRRLLEDVAFFRSWITRKMATTLTTSTFSSETTPLLTRSSSNQSQTLMFPQIRIFSCAVIGIVFLFFCTELTLHSILWNLYSPGTRRDFLNLSPFGTLIAGKIFSGTAFIFNILGAWLAASKLGKFSVILYGTLIGLIGTILLLVGSLATTNIGCKTAVYITGLFFFAFGQGGIIINTVLFAADQVPNNGPATIRSLYYWCYGLMNIGTIFACTIFVYIQNISYVYGYFVLVCILVLAFIVFLAGKTVYIIYPPYASAYLETVKLVLEAIKKSRRPSVSNSFPDHWLDGAKTCFGGSFSSWEVEDVKNIYRLLPIIATLTLAVSVNSMMEFSMFYQSEYMDKDIAGLGFRFPTILSFTFPVVLGNIATLVLIPFTHMVVFPLLAKLYICPSQLQRIGIGILSSVASIECAGIVEWYRVEECCIKQDPLRANLTRVSNMTIFHQVPQYLLAGLFGVFTTFTAFEFILTETPKYLEAVVVSVFCCMLGFQSFVGVFLVGIVNAATESIANNKWFPDEDHINNGHYFAYFFFLLAVLMFLIFILYIYVALSFKAKKELAERANLPINTVTSSDFRYTSNSSC